MKMKTQIICALSILGLAATVTAARAEDLDSFAGKWTAQKSNSEGQKYSQQIEIKKSKFTFTILDGDGGTRLYAEGDVKLDKAGPFKTIVFSNIKAGQSATDADSIDDTYTSIYRVNDDGEWLLVTNFDKDRDSQKPSLDVYRKAKAEAKKEPKAEAK
jgi:hypothetical protein